VAATPQAAENLPGTLFGSVFSIADLIAGGGKTIECTILQQRLMPQGNASTVNAAGRVDRKLQVTRLRRETAACPLTWSRRAASP